MGRLGRLVLGRRGGNSFPRGFQKPFFEGVLLVFDILCFVFYHEYPLWFILLLMYCNAMPLVLMKTVYV